MLSSLGVSLADTDEDEDVVLSEGSGPSVHRQSLLRLRRPATGVSGQESLSDSDESRLSPARGPLGRGELSNDEKAVELEVEGMESEDDDLDAGLVLMERVVVLVVSDSSEEVVASDEMVDTEDSMSECASVYLTVLISSSKGVRNETRFSAGNSGLAEPILREVNGVGPFDSIDRRLWGCL